MEKINKNSTTHFLIIISYPRSIVYKRFIGRNYSNINTKKMNTKNKVIYKKVKKNLSRK